MAELVFEMSAGFNSEVREFRFGIGQEEWDNMTERERMEFQDECEIDAREHYVEAYKFRLVGDDGSEVDL